MGGSEVDGLDALDRLDPLSIPEFSFPGAVHFVQPG